MIAKQVRLTACGTILLVAAEAFVSLVTAGCKPTSEARAPSSSVASGPSRFEEESAIVIDDYRWAIQSLRWRGEVLQVGYYGEFIGQDRFHKGRGKWALNSPDMILYCVFWDLHKKKSADEIRVDVLHDRAFIEESTNRECHTFELSVPASAKYIAIRRGAEPWTTNAIMIPEAGAR